MPEERDRAGKIRMSLDVTPEMKEVIDSLARQQHATQAQVMRQAIALLKTVKDAETKGESPALIDKEGHVTARLVGV
jgi:predicted transcriptional regulator